MATNINYPVNLPCPLLSGNTHQPSNTFIRSEFDYAIRQRKQYCAQYSVGFSFVVKSQIQMQAFKDFFYNTLNYGVNSFLADWEIEGMDGIKEFRFSSNYTTVALGANRYRITASFDMLTKIKGLFVIPSIQYNMDIISTELDGTRYIKNDGKGGNSFNAEAFASNFIFLNGTTQSVPYPVLHDLGTEKVTSLGSSVATDDETTTFTKHSDTSFDLAVTVAGTNNQRPLLSNVMTATSNGSRYLLSFDTVVNSGTPIIRTINAGAGAVTVIYTIVNGKNEIYVDSLSDIRTTQDIFFDGTNLFDISVTNWSYKEITLPTASYLTIFQADGTIKQLSSTGDVGENLVTNGAFDTDTDWTYNTPPWTISGGKAVMTNSNSYETFSQNTTQVTGRRFAANFDIDSIIGTAKIEFNTGTTSVTGFTTIGNKVVYTDSTSTSGFVRFARQIDGASMTIDNVRMSESLPISTTYSQTDSHQFVFNHTAPLTDKDVSEIEADPNLAFRMFFDGEVLPSGFSRANDMVDCNFYGGNSGLASGAYEQDLSEDLGVDETVNGGFDTDTDWSKDAGWSIADGKATCNSAGTDAITQDNNILVTDDIFSVSYDIVDYTSGEVGLALRNSTIVLKGSSLGNKSTLIKVGSGVTDINIRAYGGFVGSIDNVEIQKATAVEIQDYDSATRTTLANQSNGASNLKLIRNGAGRTTGIATTNTTQWEADGRTAVTNWTITAPFTITEPIDGDTYTFTSDGNRYKNTVADGTYTLPTGIWTLDEFGFDGVTPVTTRGVTKKVNEIVVL